jgi:hypothetical protein
MARTAMLFVLTPVAIFSVIAFPPLTAQAAKVVQVCTPPGGVWGAGNTFRSKVVKYDDQTAVYMSQNFAQQDKSRWWRSSTFTWSGGTFKNAFNTQETVVPEGDGYKVSETRYFAHFSCVAATSP